VEELHETSSIMMQYWDEFTSLLSSFGMYKGTGAFDRAQYLTLPNGLDELRHTTKKYKYVVQNPRLSMFGAAHTHRIATILEEERTMLNCDGFINRFFVFSPATKRLTPSKQIFL
jgi:hypothetical protein